jgi:glycosyltransferase involved in cell wall biosynthesis
MLKIGIDISSISPPRTGIGNYTYYLLKYLLTLDKTNKYFLFSNRAIPDRELLQLNVKNSNLYYINLPPKIKSILWYYIILPTYLKKYSIDIFLSPAFFLPLKIQRQLKMITVIHDLIAQKYPQTHTRATRIIHKVFFKSSLKRADLILTVSQNTKKDLLELFSIPSSKVKVLYPGISPQFKIVKDKTLHTIIRKKYNLPDKYILFVGTIEPRKNLASLLKAFVYLKRKEKIPHKLVIVGKKGWLYNNIFKIIFSNNLRKEIILTGFVDERDLPVIYTLAEILVYPSIYEGFGLPPLEAMACGTPVIVSNTSSLPEVCGDAAYYVNPYDIRDIAKGILTVLKDKQLQQTLIQKGLTRVKFFNWEVTASKLIDIFYNLSNNEGIKI